MAYCTIGGLTVDMVTSEVGVSFERIGGELYRTFAGALRDPTRITKATRQRLTKPLTLAEYDALLAIIGAPAGGNVVTCNGDMFKNVATSCAVLVIDAPERKAMYLTPKLKWSIRLSFVQQ